MIDRSCLFCFIYLLLNFFILYTYLSICLSSVKKKETLSEPEPEKEKTEEKKEENGDKDKVGNLH